MSNAPSFGKSITILLIGAAVGFAGCNTSRPAVPGPVACTTPTGTDQVVEIDVVDGMITIVHDPVVVRVDECEQIVWTFDTDELSEITIDTNWNRRPDPAGFVPHPPNPFPGEFTGGEGAVVFSATSDDGELKSGLAHPKTPGHSYHFKITGTTPGGDTIVLDPHTRFD
jgi:hypothetical protein